MAGLAVGLDIGFGNLKIAFARGPEQMKQRVLPIGAGEATKWPKSLDGGTTSPKRGFEVLVDGEPWVAAVPPSMLQGYMRVLNDQYTKSKEYKALFHAALLEVGADVVDVLVTGLPVSQHLEVAEPGKVSPRAALIERLTGTHKVTESRSITVKKVMVLPQPVGGYFDSLAPGSGISAHKSGFTLVIDPGYYSVDWVCLFGETLRDKSSGSSTMATSYIVEHVADEIGKAHSAKPPVERVEDCLRLNSHFIDIRGQKVDITQSLQRHARNAAVAVVTEIRNQLRTANHDIDCIVLAGGAAVLYEPELRAAFPRAFVYRANNPVLANARGFCMAGWRQLEKKAAA